MISVGQQQSMVQAIWEIVLWNRLQIGVKQANPNFAVSSVLFSDKWTLLKKVKKMFLVSPQSKYRILRESVIQKESLTHQLLNYQILNLASVHRFTFKKSKKARRKGLNAIRFTAWTFLQ